MRRSGDTNGGTYFILLTIICIVLVIDEILLWSTAYRPHYGFMPLDLYPFIFSFLMNWKLINSFKFDMPIKGDVSITHELLPVENSLMTLAEVEKRHIVEVLQSTSWKVSGQDGAAQILDLHPNTLRSRMKKLGIKK